MPTSRPKAFARSSFSSLEALPITNAPASFASCTAAEPMPLPTELIITVSPGWSFARVKSMCHEVAKATWRPAAGAAGAPPAAGLQQVGQHPIAGLPALDPGADLGDRAHDLEAENEREGDREAGDALADVDVEVVQGAGGDLHRHLARARLRVVHLLELQDVETAELVEPHCLHAIDLLHVLNDWMSLYLTFGELSSSLRSAQATAAAAPESRRVSSPTGSSSSRMKPSTRRSAALSGSASAAFFRNFARRSAGVIGFSSPPRGCSTARSSLAPSRG